MRTRKKRPQVVKRSKASVEGSKAAVGSTHTNPYTLKFMEHWTGGRMNTRELEDLVGADAIDVRKRLLVRLLLSPHNQLQDVVLTKLVN